MRRHLPWRSCVTAMDSEARHTWISLFLATLLALGLMAAAYQSTQGPRPSPVADPSPGFGWSWDFDYRRAVQEPALTTDSETNQQPGLYPGELILPIGKPIAVANLSIVFRGPAGAGRFRVDVIIPALDPGYAYANELTRADQGRELTLYGQRFEVTAIGERVLRLRHLSP